jgi:redox-regulated HSP33 family molecular chaperone
MKCEDCGKRLSKAAVNTIVSEWGHPHLFCDWCYSSYSFVTAGVGGQYKRGVL